MAQVTANQPDPIILCDINNPGDQTEVFDLTSREGQIIGSQTNVVVTYHLTSGDALGNGGFIETPESFTNTSDPQTIFIRVENVNNANDWEITVMDLIVPFIPEIVVPAQDIIMDDPNGDGVEAFDLTRDESDVLGSQDPFEFNINYFETQADADTNSNPIANPESYTNLSNPQTIYTRFAPLQDQCQYETYNFEIFADENLSIGEQQTLLFSIYPNPTQDWLNISKAVLASDSKLQIFNINGILLIERQLSKEELSISIAEFSSGVYFVQISSEGNRQIQKLIKK